MVSTAADPSPCGPRAALRTAVLLLACSGAVALPPVVDDARLASGGAECATAASGDRRARPGTRGISLMQFGVLRSTALSVDAAPSTATGCSTLRWTGDKCLDVSDGSAENGNNVQLWDCHGGQLNQAFLLPDGGEGPVRWAKHPTKCLDVAGGQRKDGTNLQLWDCVDDSPNQRFILSDGNPGTLRWASDNYCVDVSDGASRNGNNIQMWTCHPDAPNQQFSAPSATCPAASPQGCCAPYSDWPLVDNGVTCGDTCTALVQVDDSNGGRCDQYCASFGHRCVAAAEEVSDNCEVKYTASCSQPINDTSDMLCTCRLPSASDRACSAAPAPAPAPRPSPPSGHALKVMSYNTQYTGYPSRVPDYGRKISDVNAAVVGTQENQDKRALADASGYSLVPGTDFQNPIYYNPSKVSFVSGSSGWMSIPRDRYAPRTITWAKFKFGSTGFWHFNTHLPHNHGEAHSRNTHARIARRLLEKREELGAGDAPTVVTGDMNPFASEGNSEGSFESTLVAAGFHLSYVGRGDTGGHAGLDKILASPHWASSNGADQGTGRSDHPAIAVDLTLRGR